MGVVLYECVILIVGFVVELVEIVDKQKDIILRSSYYLLFGERVEGGGEEDWFFK